MKKVRLVSALLVLIFITGIVIAEIGYFPAIPGGGDTHISGGNVAAYTFVHNGLPPATYAMVNLRVYGSAPNPKKDEKSHYCYGCTSTNWVYVWNGYFGNKTAKSFMGYDNGSGGSNYQTIYTSHTGYNSNCNCWANGC